MSRSNVRAFLVACLYGLLSACGNGAGPSGPSGIATPTPVQNTHPVSFTAFLDENSNRALESNELTRIPSVELIAGTSKASTSPLTGQATIQVPEGTLTLDVNPSSLPPFFRPPASGSISLPPSGMVNVPITAPAGSNRPMVYMGFGDSITNGDPDVPDGNGYRGFLQTMLRNHFVAGEIVNEGIDGTNTDRGAARIGDSLSRVRPAFTLILYGTNDWNQCKEPPQCVTIPSLRSMVQQVNARGGHAFVGAIIPVNVGYDDRTPPSRQAWVIEMNALIRQMADQEGAVYVDLFNPLAKSGLSGPALYVDHLHPTEPGYRIMAQTWFDAITKPYSKILSLY
jgi:lysophospholipase L1-like esterase